MPDCTRCLRLKLSPCKAADSSLSCNNCRRASVPSCDVFGVPTSEIQVLLREKRRLDREKQETLSKLLRLEVQSRALEGRAERALSREVALIEEEESVEVPPTDSSGDSSGGALPSDWALNPSAPGWVVDPSLLGDLGSVDGTAGASQGS
ncbi:hypothetical protein QBC35DRAFT_238771 [Podospora australis]|uniref:Zn(2)-C6 fungal-type domain-containing protein n=1 Tax=Podospora australis TaxID=1536484 RepID=A0AAN7ACZ1_9PEZI|nr:hypothetical protein QBC35DRAFT_238771 [Podospora australis]